MRLFTRLESRRGLAVAGVAAAALCTASLVAPPASAIEPTPAVTCGGLTVTILGTDKADRLRGTKGVDVISAGLGDDTVDGANGDDVICGGPGRDQIMGGAGADMIHGQLDDDLIDAGSGDDIVYAGDGNDKVLGSIGKDTVVGGPGNDTLGGGSANDALFGQDGDDTLEGGPGDDLLSGDAGADSVEGGSGSDSCSAEKVHRCEKPVDPSDPSAPATDTDGDGVVDTIEIIAHTDPRLSDTDGDGLSDDFEISFGGDQHQPTKADTDGDGLGDAKEDVDADGLTALQEQEAGSSPVAADTDGDKLSDKAEVDLGTSPSSIDTDKDDLDDGKEGPFGTSPTKADTDGDGLTDGEEFRLGTNPNVKDNTGTFTVKVDGPAGTSVSFTGGAKPILAAEVQVPENAAIAKTAGIIGNPVEVTVPKPVTSGTVEFRFDPTTVAAGTKLAVLHFNTTTGAYEMAPNQHIDLAAGTASTTTTSFSPFVLVRLDQFTAAFKDAMTVPRTGPGGATRPADSGLIIDSSGSMGSNDPGNDRLVASKAFIDALLNGDRVSVTDFDHVAVLRQPFTSDFAAAKAAVDLIDSDGGTDIGAGVKAALDEFDARARPTAIKIAVLLTDGEGSYDPALTRRAKDAGVIFYTVALGTSTDETLLQGIANDTGGKFFKIADATDLPDLFDRIGSDPGAVDTDGDGITDKTETEGIRDATGNRVKTDPTKADTDGDGLSDGQEAGKYEAAFLLTGTMVGDYYWLDSDPTVRDTDRDGLDDKEEVTYKTKPRNSDTDGDGVTDGQEVVNGTDPVAAPVLPTPKKGKDIDVKCGYVTCTVYLSNSLTTKIGDTIAAVGFFAAVIEIGCLVATAVGIASVIGAAVAPYTLMCAGAGHIVFTIAGAIGYLIDQVARHGGCLTFTTPKVPVPGVPPVVPAFSTNKFCKGLG